MEIRKELLDELMKEYDGPEDLLGPDGLLKQLKAALVERALQEEMTDHLGHEKNAPQGRTGTNVRNGSSPKTLRSEDGELPIRVPRDREGSFEPQLVPKHRKRCVTPRFRWAPDLAIFLCEEEGDGREVGEADGSGPVLAAAPRSV